ncbi:probable cysteine protease RDL3 [Helianthus annuus]|nr:probable cysteine protease RDL3 [Helianthus annuus]
MGELHKIKPDLVRSDELRQEGQFGAMAATEDADRKRFEDWMKEYNKEYKTPDEEAIRFSAFKENLCNIEAHLANPNLAPHWKGLTQFSDMTLRQFLTEYLGCTFGGGYLVASDEHEDEEEDEVQGQVLEDEDKGKRVAEVEYKLEVSVKHQRRG